MERERLREGGRERVIEIDRQKERRREGVRGKGQRETATEMETERGRERQKQVGREGVRDRGQREM